MKTKLIHTRLSLILNKLKEFKSKGEIEPTKPEFERLFSDFSLISKELKSIYPEIFDDVDSSITFSKTNTISVMGDPYSIYDNTCLELLLFEVEKTLEYISIVKMEENESRWSSCPQNALDIIAERFHLVVRQLRKRYGNREIFSVTDEYDVQDLYHSLLKLFFDDVRPESYVPEYAGGNSRIDFVLKTERIAIEIKKTRESLKAKELGEQLIIDIERYKQYPEINCLFCFVYDPDGWIENPTGIENDLSKTSDGLSVIVKIKPE